MKIKGKTTDEVPATEEMEDLQIDDDIFEDIDPEPEIVVRKAKPKAKNKKPVVIMEESESESEDDSNVIYIKRGRNKKTEKPVFVHGLQFFTLGFEQTHRPLIGSYFTSLQYCL